MLIVQFLIGILVGVYSYLMPGYINLKVLQLGMDLDKKKLKYSLFIISIVEIPYCFVSMNSIQWLTKQDYILEVLKWLIVLVLVIVAIITILDANKVKEIQSVPTEKLNQSQLNKLLLFVIFNPFQLSAWAIWGTYFIEKTWFSWTYFSILIFSLGASVGVAIILYIYAIIGEKMISYFTSHRKKIDYSVAGLLFLLATVQVIKNLL